MLGIPARLQEIKTGAITLARLQLELAMLEFSRKAKALGVAAALAIVALVCVLYAVGFVFAAAAAGLVEVVPLWGALLIVSFLLLVTAVVLVLVAARFARKAGPVPVETVTALPRTSTQPGR